MEREERQHNLRAALDLLTHLAEAGRPLKVSEVLDEVSGERAVVRSRLQALADHLPWVDRQGEGRGVAQTFQWIWPADQRARPEQVWALAAARTMLDVFRDGEVGTVLTALLEDHIRRLHCDRPGRDELDRMFMAATRLINPHGIEADKVDRLATAITQRVRVTASYTQFGGQVLEVELEPWTLLFADEGPYLVARCAYCSKVDHIDVRRIYNVARLDEVRPTREPFTYPVRSDYDPATMLRFSFGVMVPAPAAPGPHDIVLRFEPGMRHYLARHRIHETQGEPEVDPGGRTTVKLRLYVTYDLVRWIRGHGRTVEVLGPEHLRAWVLSGDGGDAYATYALAHPSLASA